MRLTGRRTLLKLALACSLVLFFVPSAVPADRPTVFASHPHPVDLTFNGEFLLAVGGDAPTTECSNAVTAYDATGASHVFATLPDQPGCLGSELENHLTAVPPGLGQWGPPTRVYVVRGSKIYTLDAAGAVSLFASWPCPDDGMPDLTFDQVGTFGNKLILTCARDGTAPTVYTATPDGTVTLLGTYPTIQWIEGPQVAPLGFPTYGGQLFMVSEQTNGIYAVSPAGALATVGTWPGGAEDVQFVPQTLCEFGGSGGALFTSVPGGGGIQRRPASQFAGLAGKALVSGENGTGLGVLTAPGSIAPLESEQPYRTYEGSAFARCAGPVSVALTAPTDGASFAAPATISLSAHAYSDTAVAKVDFYQGTTLVGTATSPPYTFSWTNVPTGFYSVTAVATDDHGNAATSRATNVAVFGSSAYAAAVLADNPLAYWRLDEPSGAVAFDRSPNVRTGAYVGGPGLGAAGATLTDSDAAVALDGTTQYAEVPYGGATNPAGAFSVEAWARVSGGAGTYRAVLTSRATPPQAGYVVYAGADNKWQFWIGGASFWVVARGSPVALNTWTHLVGTYEPLGGGNVRARLYVNGALAGETTTSATFVANQGKPLRIGAGQTEGAPGFFFPGRIDDVALYPGALAAARVSAHYVAARGTLSVSLTGPAEGSTYVAPATIPLSATAGGPVAKVDFYQGTTLIGTATSAPYSFTWTNVPAGTYRLLAVASDEQGSSVGSSTVTVQVFGGSAYADAVLADAAVGYWRLGETTGATAFDRTGNGRNGAYKQAPALGGPGALGGDADAAAAFDGSSQYAEIAYASALNPGATGGFTVEAWAKVTGGAGSYRSVVTSRSTTPNAGYALYAASDNKWEFRAGNASAWVIARGGPVSANTWTYLVGTVEPIGGGQTRLRLYVDGTLAGETTTSSNVARNTSRPLRIAAGMTEGAPGFFLGGAVDEVAVYATALTAAKIASHYSTSKGTLNVVLTGPADASTFTAPATIALSAAAGGPVAKVDFYQGTTLIGTATSAPYTVSWANVAAGTYQVTAVAGDAQGNTVSSAASTVEVFGASSYASSVLADNPVAFWRLGETAGAIAFDRTAGARNGAYVQSPTLNGPGALAADADGAVAFDGASQYEETPFAAALNPTGAFSVEAWAKVSGGSGTYRSIVTSRTATPQAGYMLYAAADNKWEFRVGAGASWLTARGATLTPGRWTYLVGTVEPQPGGGVRVRLYVDGALAGETTSSSNVAANQSRPLRLGAGQTEGAAGFFLPGAVDEVAVYNQVLPETRIGAHYSKGKGAAALGVTLTGPADGSTSTAPATIALAATASGAVAGVDFYDGTTLLGTATAPPYAFDWTNVAAGTYRLSARARDDEGNVAASNVVTVQVFGASGYADAVLADHPVAYWRLGETVGATAFDRSGGGQNGAYKQSPALHVAGALSGDFDGAVAFDGATQYEETPYAAALNPAGGGGFSVEAWAKVTGGAGSYRAVATSRNASPQAGYILYAASNDHWQLWTGSGSLTFSTVDGGPIATGTWTHLVGTVEPQAGGGVRLRLYVNGALAGETTGSSAFLANQSNPLRVAAGQTEGAPGFYFPGSIDEVAVYGAVLPDARIAAHYATGTTG